jgi:hypothetical protein
MTIFDAIMQAYHQRLAVSVKIDEITEFVLSLQDRVAWSVNGEFVTVYPRVDRPYKRMV